MRIAFFGGSFNPPHVAHQMACLYVLAAGSVERVLWVPVAQHPFAKDLAGFADRFEMCRRAAAPFGDAVVVSRVEEDLGGPSRTLHTLRHLIAEHPAERFVLVIGTDILPERDKWYGWDELRRLVDVVVIGRGGFPGARNLPVELPRLSSSDIRERLARGEDVAGMVPATVLRYIEERGLYGAHGKVDDA